MASTDKAIQLAVSQVGKPYIWGAAGPRGFDCSGLLWWAYKNAGFKVSASRWTTYTMLSSMKKVDPKNPAPGDFLFPHTGHVVMYIGGKKVVEAPRTGLNVRVMPWTESRWVYARRFATPGTGVSGSGAVNADYTEGTTVDMVSSISGTIDAVKGLYDFFQFISNPHSWLRILTIGAGLVMLYAGIQLALVGTTTKKVLGAVTG